MTNTIESGGGNMPDTDNTMTEAQRTALQSLCERYRVGFDPTHYAPSFDLPDGYVAGWVGGYAIQEQQPTIYVGCSAEGHISS
jgi:hypothetical protein